MPKRKTGSRTFGAFSGVFVPTFLSIVGVILFLRLGNVVGGAGVLGSVAIVLLAVSVTLSTGLALSSISSNIKIGSGGAYSIISKTLGLEVGGSVGIPLFLAQAFSVALYIFGFVEAWKYLFPTQPAIFIAITAFFLLFALVFISTKIAVRAQIFVFVFVCLSLGSVFLGGNFAAGGFQVPLIDFSQIPFWTLFALFFPAVTGLMAGVGMSGELSNPKEQIPKGVLWGLGITTVIYIAMIVFLSYSATSGQLLSNNLILVDLAFFSPLVLIGILAATFSSALTTFVAAPRVLLALSENHILPESDFLKKKTEKGEPRNAIVITSLIIVSVLFLGSLDVIAPVLTMFFLIAYAMINISVFIEQYLGLLSFRPTFKIPKLVSLYGALGSIIMMFLINAIAGFIAVVFLVFIYGILAHRKLVGDRGDVRSGLFRSISEWAAKKTKNMPSSKHIWKPNILIPVLTVKTLVGNFPLIESITKPFGTMTVLGFKLKKNIKKNPEKKDITKKEMNKELKELPSVVKKFGKSGIFTSFSNVETEDYVEGLITSQEAIESQTFAPNILFLPYRPHKLSVSDLNRIVESSVEQENGVLIFDKDSEIGLGSEEDIHVWLSSDIVGNDLSEDRYYDLALLVSYALQRNWKGKMKIWMCVNKNEMEKAERYLKRVIYDARMPDSTEINVVNGRFENTLKSAPDGDIHIIPFRESGIDKIKEIADIGGKTILFVLDSTEESVFA